MFESKFLHVANKNVSFNVLGRFEVVWSWKVKFILTVFFTLSPTTAFVNVKCK